MFVSSLNGTPKTATFYSLTQTISDTTGAFTEAYSETGAIDVYFYEGSASDSIVSEKFKTEIVGTILVDYALVDFTISDSDKVIIDGISYAVIHATDIGLQGVVYQIPVRAF